MPILSSELSFRYSNPDATAGNTVPQTDSTTSIGKYVSTTVWPGGTNSLFDDLTADQNMRSESDYRCVFLCNNNTKVSVLNLTIWVEEPGQAVTISLAVDPTPASSQNSTAAQSVIVSNDSTAPQHGVIFSEPDEGSPLEIGDIGPQQCRAVWIRRSAENTTALNGDGFKLQIKGDSPP